MTVEELIKELEKLPKDLDVMVAGESARKVIVENCQGYSYVRIFEGLAVDVVLGSAGLEE